MYTNTMYAHSRLPREGRLKIGRQILLGPRQLILRRLIPWMTKMDLSSILVEIEQLSTAQTKVGTFLLLVPDLYRSKVYHISILFLFS